jgi:phosphohistidine phosphatase
MKTVYFVRHAKSSWDSPNLRDIDRQLNDSGLKTAEKMALFMSDLDVRPDVIISSPAKRAYSTAVFFAKSFGIETADIRIAEEIYEALMSDILQLINGLPQEIDTVMLFGHNPTLTNLANYFSPDFIPNVPTCGILKVEANTNNWTQFNNQTAGLVKTYFPKEVL